MRLIDADELKKCKVYSEERHEYVVAVFNIDNAPTVDKGYNEGHIDGMLQAEKLYARPIGEWKLSDNRWGLGSFRCSNCNIYYDTDPNFCPNCGAMMKQKWKEMQNEHISDKNRGPEQV